MQANVGVGIQKEAVWEVICGQRGWEDRVAFGISPRVDGVRIGPGRLHAMTAITIMMMIMIDCC